MQPIRFAFAVLFCAACLQQVDVGSTEVGCAEGERTCPCEGCTPEDRICACPAAPAGCEYSQTESCTVCAEHIICPQACDAVSCPAGSRCCGCNGCVVVGAECPSQPARCTIAPGCRLEGSDVENMCDCGRHICPGECDELPGGECEEREYCEFASNCNALAGAMCESRPTECPIACTEVCGCDGVTYCNTCEARRVGIDVGALGPC